MELMGIDQVDGRRGPCNYETTAAAAAVTGVLEVKKVAGKSTPIRCFATYPLKFILPTKAGAADSDAVWAYSVTFGGGIVSGDCIRCEVNVGENCTTVMKTQASTKVYKAIGTKCSEQHLEARLGKNALLAVLPDPVTCFSKARYYQKQIFRIFSDSNLVLVDWLTSGRRERGEKWDFDMYKSINQIFIEDNHPLFLDSVLLEQSPSLSIAERMQDYQVSAMLVVVGPKLKHVQNQIRDEVSKSMSPLFGIPSASRWPDNNKTHKIQQPILKPELIASSSAFGPKDIGLVVRVAATATEPVYRFLEHHLACIQMLIGALPY